MAQIHHFVNTDPDEGVADESDSDESDQIMESEDENLDEVDKMNDHEVMKAVKNLKLTRKRKKRVEEEGNNN
jgi:hypothetical protein